MKAYSYLRISSIGSIDGDGFPRQRTAIERYAKANGIEIVEEFRDEGVPGTTEMQDRAGLAQCMSLIESGDVKLVLVESADRLARDFMISEFIIREFQKFGARVITANGGVDLTAGDNQNPTAKLVRQILAAVAEFDRCMIVLKMRAARERIRTKNGKCEGRKSYGSRAGEQEMLDKMRFMEAQGLEADQIAAELNLRGFLTRYGKQWNSGTIWKILARHKQSTGSPIRTESLSPKLD